MQISLCAHQSDSTFRRHELSFSMTNAMSHTFFKNYNGVSTSAQGRQIVTVNPEGGLLFKEAFGKAIPGYATQIKVVYSLGLSNQVRLETGIGYLLIGSIMDFSNGRSSLKYAYHIFQGSLDIPLHVKIKKQLKKGWFSCVLGPHFLIPLHQFSQIKVPTTYYMAEHTYSNHQRYAASDISYYSSMGFDIKMGYEHLISHKASIDIGPIFSFTNLVLFSKERIRDYNDMGVRPFAYYIGLDVAINLGLK